MTETCSSAVWRQATDDIRERGQPASGGADGDDVVPGHESPLPTHE